MKTTNLMLMTMNKSSLPFHPILNLQSFNAAEVVCVACDDNEILLKSCCSDKHIHVANLQALFLQFTAYLSIFEKVKNAVRLEERRNLIYFVEMFFAARLNGSKIQLGNSDIRNLAIMHTNVPKMLDDTWLFLQQRDAVSVSRR